MSKKLTRKQLLAFSRALKRRGRKLPKVGMCAILDRHGTVASSIGVAGEICHYRDGYYHIGGFERRHKDERRRVNKLRGKVYRR